ncbi:MAG: CRISPR-associated endoribonuclease Cas6 [candidate division KSB1 bacterium]|nr:CRISPR-associated endoribonuclease Cas6 [candidate division KSB1 bacterium]
MRRLYTVSGLFLNPKPRPDGNMLPLVPRTCAKLFISSPMIDEYNMDKVINCFQGQMLHVDGGGHHSEFIVNDVKIIPVPMFQSPCRFLCLSPLVFSQERGNKNRPFTYYYRPDDKELPSVVRHSLITKHEQAYGVPPQDKTLDFRLCINPQQRRITRLVHVHENEPNEFFVRAIFTRFVMSGSTQLMRTAWECGLGEHCSLGFGCVGID